MLNKLKKISSVARGYLFLPQPSRQPSGGATSQSTQPASWQVAGYSKGRGSQRGFTLVEMIIVMVITGIIGSMVAVFIKAPVQGYVDSARRAELTDIADTAQRRMARDVRSAVPNSLRIGLLPLPAVCPLTQPCVEFIQTKDGNRYSTQTPNDVLSFNDSTEDRFDIFGAPISFSDSTGLVPDYIVVGSTQSDGSLPYDRSVNGVLRKHVDPSGAGLKSRVIFEKVALPPSAELDSQRFSVVDGTQQAVTYACEGTLGTLDANQNGQGRLVRHWAYGFNSTQLAPSALGGSSALLADKVSACSIDYDIVNQRFGLLAIRLTLTSGGESATLYNEIHVNNLP